MDVIHVNCQFVLYLSCITSIYPCPLAFEKFQFLLVVFLFSNVVGFFKLKSYMEVI